MALNAASHKRPTQTQYATALGLTRSAMTWRLKHWPRARALSAPRKAYKRQGESPPEESTIARAIAAYYEDHPEEIPPWQRA